MFTFGNAAFKGSVGALNVPVVGMATTPLGNGYWMAASDGGIFAFNVPFLGSTGGIKLNKPVVTIIASPLGSGYWLVASDGGVFNFGVPLFGSTGSVKLNKPIVGAAATPTGQGYWLVASDGGIFSFGDAAFFGSTGAILNKPIVGMASTPTGQGYWLVASDGGIFSFGDAAFFGSTGATPLNRPIVGIASTPTGLGYWMTASDGGIFSFGDATFFGSAGGLRLTGPVVSIVAVPNTGPGKVGIFYYPWYGTPTATATSGWRHWDQGGHSPPDDIGSTYYPARGPYSSNDPAVVDQQMAEIAKTGVNQVIVSWWGRGTYEDQALSVIQPAAAAHGLDVAIHFEPYVGRGSTGPADIAYLVAKGYKVFYAYQATSLNSSFWASIRAQNPDIAMFAHGSPSYTKSGQGGLINFALLGASTASTPMTRSTSQVLTSPRSVPSPGRTACSALRRWPRASTGQGRRRTARSAPDSAAPPTTRCGPEPSQQHPRS